MQIGTNVLISFDIMIATPFTNATSLGLQLVYSLVVQQLRGKIELDKTNGAKFYISLPCPEIEMR